MITKAIIERVSNTSANKYIIRIPLFEKPGIDSVKSTLSSSLFEATVSHTPGIKQSYKKGDVVFVSFENSELDRPVIVGKLLITGDTTDIGAVIINSLQVTDKAILPKNTSIDGVNLGNISQFLKAVEDKLQELRDLGDGAEYLFQLQDTSIIDIDNKHILQYNDATQKWENVDPSNLSNVDAEYLRGKTDEDFAEYNHSHGNITNQGKIGTSSGLMLKTGTGGLITTLNAGSNTEFLRGDGTWATPPNDNDNTEYDVATSITLGLVKLGNDTTINSNADKTYPIQLNSNNQMFVSVPWTNTLYDVATSTNLGLVKLGSDTVINSTLTKTYPIQINSSKQMFVSVPWTNTLYGVATSGALGLVKLGNNTVIDSSLTKTYPIQLNSSNQMFVSVPWENTAPISYGVATDSVLGLVKLGSSNTIDSTLNKTYPIQLNSSNQMFVSVPWENTPPNSDTKNTAGNYTSPNKLYIIGAESVGVSSSSYATTRLNSSVYIENNTIKSFSMATDVINGLTHGNAIMRQYTDGNVIIGSNIQKLRLTGNETRPKYATTTPTTDSSNYKELALLTDIPDVSGFLSNTMTGPGVLGRTQSSSGAVGVLSFPTIRTQMGLSSNILRQVSFSGGTMIVEVV